VTDRTEADRIRRVYDAYETDPRVQARRDPDNRANVLIEHERVAVLDDSLAGAGLSSLAGADILDVGCGAGDELLRLQLKGAEPSRCHGIDLIPDRVRRARELLQDADLREGDARELPFGRETMDVVVLKVVLSSVLAREISARIAAETDRVLRPGGTVLWYDNRYANPFNRQVRGISRRELAHLFPAYEQRLSTVTVVPPLVRRFGAATDRGYAALRSLKPLRVRYAGVLVKPGGHRQAHH
jgi:ubiquinone/menaquinone biosynthesis C-methylase UbiE